MITRAVAALVVRTGDSGEHSQRRRAMEDSFGLIGVQAHFLPIVGRQRARLPAICEPAQLPARCRGQTRLAESS